MSVDVKQTRDMQSLAGILAQSYVLVGEGKDGINSYKGKSWVTQCIQASDWPPLPQVFPGQTLGAFRFADTSPSLMQGVSSHTHKNIKSVPTIRQCKGPGLA